MSEGRREGRHNIDGVDVSLVVKQELHKVIIPRLGSDLGDENDGKRWLRWAWRRSIGGGGRGLTVLTAHISGVSPDCG